MANAPKSKLGYFSSYSILLSKIEANLVDAYDLCYVNESKTLYILDKQLNPVEIQSRIDSYQSEASAIAALNSKIDTYEGQIVNILVDGKYIPYTVNKDSSAVIDSYYITRISIDDYNDLINKPIENIVANEEVILSELDDGIYSLVGNYRISPLDETHRMITSKEFIIKETVTDEDNIDFIHITEISGKSIKNYICTNASFIEDRYVLLSELGNTVEDIIQLEVPQMIEDYVGTHEATDEDIRNLFPDE